MSGDLERWRERRACRDEGPEVFFPNPKDLDGQDRALAVCAHCPVLMQCRAAGNKFGYTGKHGIWGGVAIKPPPFALKVGGKCRSGRHTIKTEADLYRPPRDPLRGYCVQCRDEAARKRRAAESAQRKTTTAAVNV